MRRELHPPENDGTLTQLLEEAFARFESGESPVDLADWLSAQSGYRVRPEWLDGAFGSVGPVQAAWALRAEADPQLVPQAKPTRDELVETVERLMPDSATYDSDREAYWAELLDAHFPSGCRCADLPPQRRRSRDVGCRGDPRPCAGVPAD
jgi:hypothetical protein